MKNAILSLAMPAPCATVAPQRAFFARLSALCGRAFAGHVVTAAAAAIVGQPMVMQARECNPT